VNPPLIKIEIEGMRQIVMHAMSERFAAMDAEVQAALDSACKNFDYQGETVRIANDCIRRAIDEAVRAQFSYGGAGYEAVQAVAKTLAENALKKVAKR